MANEERGMTPKEQRKLAERIGRTFEWLRTIGIYPLSTQWEIRVQLTEYKHSLVSRRDEIDALINTVQNELDDFVKERETNE